MISDVTSNGAIGASVATASSSGAVLGKDEFLELLVAQLQNQDPLNPSDPTEFTAQLAQFSSLEQLFNVNENLSGMAEAFQANKDLERLSAVNLLGRQIEVPGPDFHFGGVPVEFRYDLETAANNVQVKVVNGQGEVVAVLPQAAGESGEHSLYWDGTGLNGLPVAPGDYKLEVARVDGEVSTDVPVRIRATVTSVEMGGLESVLTTSAGDFGLEEVLNVAGS